MVYYKGNNRKNTNDSEKTTITFESMLKKRCCYADSIANFDKTNEKDFMQTIRTNFKEEHVLKLEPEQIYAWLDSYRVMEKISLDPNINIIFEAKQADYVGWSSLAEYQVNSGVN